MSMDLSFAEGERHAASDDHLVHLVEHILDQLDLVRHLGAAQDGQEGALGVVQGLNMDKVEN